MYICCIENHLKIKYMKTSKDYTDKQIDAIVEYCQPEYCSWVGEWMAKNNENEINKYNVWDYLADTIDDVDDYIQEFLQDFED
jgi:hypothetical protein